MKFLVVFIFAIICPAVESCNSEPPYCRWSKGQCDSDNSIKQACCLTCNQNACKDEKAWCAKYATRSTCDADKEFYGKNCRKSCGWCTSGTTNTQVDGGSSGSKGSSVSTGSVVSGSSAASGSSKNGGSSGSRGSSRKFTDEDYKCLGDANVYRKAHGANPLVLDADLTRIAQRWANTLAR